MTLQNKDMDRICVRRAVDPEEIRAAQRLRYEVFYEEYGAKPDDEMSRTRLDKDDFDQYADHLIVVDNTHNDEKIVGTYRLLRQEKANHYGRFYTSSEYDLSPILSSDSTLLELGRSCVLPAYRTRPVLQLLWQGIADFVSDYNIDLMFGCASLHETNIDEIAESLSYLYHFHLAEADLRAKALNGQYVDMNLIPKEEINPKKAFSNLPPLIKGYLRVGAMIGDGAVIDEQFNTTDVCIIVQTSDVTHRYRKHYERKNQKAMPGTNETDDSADILQGSA